MDEYDEKRQYTPLIAACASNSTETLAVLLEHGANPNVFYDPNKIKKTTMHFAAQHGNIKMMKLLINYGFDCDKLINNIYYSEHNASVFLILCGLGNVQCMNYLLSYCKNNNYEIKIEEKTVESMNGLQIAIYFEQLEMVEYLLTKVYDNDKLRMEIMDQRVGNGNHHTFELAACNSTQDGLEIFKLLRKYECPIAGNDQKKIFRYAAVLSPLIFEYILNEQLYPNFGFVEKKSIELILVKAQATIIYQNMEIVVRYLHDYSIKHHHSLKMKKCHIINTLAQIMGIGSFDSYFKFIKHLIEILLDTDDWKYFIKSDLIDKQVLAQIWCKITEENNGKDKSKWCKLLDTMCKSIEKAETSLLVEYDCQDDTKNDDDYIHNDYRDTIDTVSHLNTLLIKKQFKQFSLKIKSYDSTSTILKRVESLNLTVQLLVWMFGGIVGTIEV